jgi:transcription elongation factor GreB
MPDYISAAGYRALTDEYDWLFKTERPRITAEVAYAASLGDRSENAEYIYGKKRLREIDRRMRYLRNRIESVEVVRPQDVAGSRIRFGATVVVEDQEGEEATYVLVGVDEADVKAGRISYRSPIGRALIGREEGDEAVIHAPGGRRSVEILEVRYEPEPE